ncbi:hypothetical protein NUACC21_81450 [Scytonema sp. NUACC21]
MRLSRWWAVFLAVATVELLLLIKLLTSEHNIQLLITIVIITGLLVLTIRIEDLNRVSLSKEGLEAELSRIKKEVKGKVDEIGNNINDKVNQLEDDINALLISTVLDAYEYITLKKITGAEKDDSYQFTYPKGQDLLERLKNRGLICELEKPSIFDNKNPRLINVTKHFRITERGKKYLEIVDGKGLGKVLENIATQ